MRDSAPRVDTRRKRPDNRDLVDTLGKGVCLQNPAHDCAVHRKQIYGSIAVERHHNADRRGVPGDAEHEGHHQDQDLE